MSFTTLFKAGPEDTEEGSCPSNALLAERASFSTCIRIAVSFASQPYNFGVLLARSDSPFKRRQHQCVQQHCGSGSRDTVSESCHLK